MRNSGIKLLTAILFVLVVNSCSSSEDLPANPTAPFPTSDPTLMPIFDVIITANPPESTQADANIALVLLDEVSGWPHNAKIIPMQRLSDGRWQVTLNPPAGSLIRYRYMRSSPIVQFEAGSDGKVIQNRVLHISGSSQVEDVIASWDGIPYTGDTGRVIGRLVDATTGEPLREMIASIAGNTIFTDSNGSFRVNSLVPGLHTITAFSTDGSYTPAQQGAVVQAGSTTPAQMGLFPATPVRVTFEVTVPEDTLEGTQLRISGNLRQFGHIFTELYGGIANAVNLMPTLIEVDPTHYIFIADLYSGTHFRYKYTLGDGLVNAERDEDGSLVTRDVIIPNEDIIIRDTVESWQGEDQGNVLFWLEVPSLTPSTDVVSLQLNPITLTSPIPMYKIGDQQWFYTLYSYPVSEGDIEYRYCRNEQCGIADDLQTSSLNARWRRFIPSKSQIDLRDTVVEWNWFKADDQVSIIPSLQIAPRSGFTVGVELLPKYTPSWESSIERGLQDIANFNANAIILTPSWVVGDHDPEPEIEFDPAHSPYFEHLKRQVEVAQSLNLQVALHPALDFGNQDVDEWWKNAARDSEWWSVWFERYKSFLLTYAQVAAEMQVAKLIVGGPEVSPSLPTGILSDGTPSGLLAEGDMKWREIIDEVRAIFPGRIAFELELERSIPTIPTFLDAIDEIHIYWHAPLATTLSAGIQEYQSAAKSILSNVILSSEAISSRPIYLSVEYASFDGTALPCEYRPEIECLDAEVFDLGAEGNALVPLDLQEQADALYAVIAEAYIEPRIQGVFVRRYNPVVRINDKSASVFGKPAQAVLELWYSQITGN